MPKQANMPATIPYKRSPLGLPPQYNTEPSAMQIDATSGDEEEGEEEEDSEDELALAKPLTQPTLEQRNKKRTLEQRSPQK